MQSPACQKEHWKVHKSICKRYQEERESVPDEFNKVYQALRDWVRQKDPALGFAANEALLPAKDLPDRNLLDTHVLVVNLAESPKDSGKFDVLQVRVAPHKELKDNFRMLSGNDEQYFELINNLARMREGTEKRMGKKLYGTVYTMIRCVLGDRLAMQVHPYFIKQEAVDEKMKENARKDWVEQFKAYVSAGQRFFQTPDGAVFMVGGL
ncbi:hypothetical protein FRB99_004523 [Tulasnella sp. 403]|nr:hypothetical protein FRB99_004523 [Tulasnella sp. 403]